MNPMIVATVGKVIGRFLDKSKPLGLTNLATAGGAGIIYLGFLLVQEGETSLQYAGYALMTAGAAVSLIKELKA